MSKFSQAVKNFVKPGGPPQPPVSGGPPVQTPAKPALSSPNGPDGGPADVYDKIAASLSAGELRDQAAAQRQAAEHHAKRHWPADKQLPVHHVRHAGTPCPKCRRVLLDTGVQSAVIVSAAKSFAYFRCKACEHRWKLPVKEA